jgi:MFS family permease
MERFRLEEILRVLFISVVASAVSIITLFVADFLQSSNHTGASTGGAIVWAIIFFLVAWPVGLALTFILGLLLHVALRPWRLPRIAVLPFFIGVAALATWLLFQRDAARSDEQFIAVAISIISWLLYCFGPLSLWRYRFDPTSDSDF